jgi:hypothetical protein
MVVMAAAATMMKSDGFTMGEVRRGGRSFLRRAAGGESQSRVA